MSVCSVITTPRTRKDSQENVSIEYLGVHFMDLIFVSFKCNVMTQTSHLDSLLLEKRKVLCDHLRPFY